MTSDPALIELLKSIRAEMEIITKDIRKLADHLERGDAKLGFYREQDRKISRDD